MDFWTITGLVLSCIGTIYICIKYPVLGCLLLLLDL